MLSVKDILAGLVVGCLAAAAILFSGYMLHGWNVGNVPSYELSTALGGLLSRWSLAAGALVVLLLARRPYSSFVISGCVVPLPMLVAICYEVVKYPTSHNLIPFEFIGLMLGSVLLHVPAVVCKMLLALVKRGSRTEVKT